MFETKNYKKIFLVRFLGYLFILVGALTVVLAAEPVLTEEARFKILQATGGYYTLPKVITSGSTTLTTNNATPSALSVSPQPSGQSAVTPPAEQGLPAARLPDGQGRQGFANLLMGGSEMVVPVSTDFGIVIEKIGANARVIPDVDPGSEKAYIEALSEGVAHAKGSSYPGQVGNTYLFSHSTDAPWNIVRYNAIFYLLNKLEVGDRIIVFYNKRRFDYIVFDKTIVKGSDTHFLSNTYQEPVLTLQTCDPPGTIINRLVVRAKLEANR